MRALLVIGGLVELIALTYMARRADPLSIAIATLFIIANGIHLVYFVNQKLGLNLSQKQIELKEDFFDFMEYGDYKELMNAGKWQMIPEDIYLVEEGKSLKKLIFITDGEVDIYKKKDKLNSLGRGNFIGEISFFKGIKTTADAVTKTEVEYIYWEKETLIEMMEKNNDVKIALYAVINRDLMDKLSHSK
jgi:signal-transduction protein with cAMP-binding, CBS, and nucleotidyltransferase domain